MVEADEPRTLIVERLRGHLANGSFTAALEASGRWSVHVIDVVPRLRRHPWRLALMGIAALLSYGPGLLTGRRSLRDVIWRTPTAMRLMRAEVMEAVEEIGPREPCVTLQIQSMFDGHVDGVPHFVYTDHTHLANLSYPTFDRRLLYSRAWIDCERDVYRHASACFVRSRHVADSLEADYGFGPERIHFAYAGPNVDAPRARMARPDESSDIVFVGVDWERKGGPVLVEAFGRVHQEFPDATLTVVGCQPREEAGMRVVGRVPLEDVAQYLSSGGIFCLPTRVEPFGIAVIEAMTRGLPVVATNVGAIPDIVEDGESGILVPPDDVEALASALSTLLASPTARRRAGQRAREIADERFTWQAVIGRVSPVLELAVAGTR